MKKKSKHYTTIWNIYYIVAVIILLFSIFIKSTCGNLSKYQEIEITIPDDNDDNVKIKAKKEEEGESIFKFKRDSEEVACETVFEGNLLRNGLGDDSYFVWSEKTIPYVIGEGFNETNTQNIQEAIDDYNRIFKDCIKWKLRTDEVS